MTIAQMESKYARLITLLAWIQDEVQRGMDEIRAARLAEEAAYESMYALSCNEERDEAYEQELLAEKYTVNACFAGAEGRLA